MNERILNLARIAQGNNPADYAPDDNVILLATQDVEKFAELIVKECDRYVAEHYDEYEPYIKPGDLLKHFGVE
jgi:hypothetical protein